MRKFRNFRLMFNGPGEEGGGGTPPAPTPTPPAPTPPAPVPTPPAAPAAPAAPTGPETFSREYVHELREEAKTNRITASELQTKYETAQAELATAQQIIAQAEAEKAEAGRLTSVTTAAENLADPAILLDSETFKAHIAQVNLSDNEALKASITEFVEKNPHYKLQPTLPGTSGSTPGGGGQSGATTLEGAIAASLK